MEPRIHRFPVGTGPYAVEVRNPAGSVTVDAVEDHELGWYAVQELSALVALEA